MVCRPCQLGKQTKAKHPSTQTLATSRPLELLHLDLMGSTKIESLGGKRYIMVVVDDFTRYTWVILLRSKFDASEHIERKYHIIRDIIVRGDVVVAKIESANNLADPFTKALPQRTFESHLEGMGVRLVHNSL